MTTTALSPLRTTILTAGAVLTGELRVPESTVGAIVCAHAGWTDLEPRSAEITDALWDAGFATLWVDLHVPGDEEEDVPLLAGRLVDATLWLRNMLGPLPIGYLGAGTGASAALWSAGALASLPGGEHELAVVPGATHFFEQYETLERATRLAAAWFSRHV
jgi:hypothetical protein